MFDKNKKTILKISKIAVKKKISEEELNRILEEFEINLLECELPFNLVEKLSQDLRNELINNTFSRNTEFNKIIKDRFTLSINNIFNQIEEIDLIELIKSSEKPFKILIVGINGSGKTTTIAKIGNLLKTNNLSVVLVAADTFRAGAIEQIKEHANRLDIKIIAQKYGSDPAAVSRDGVEYSKLHNIDVVLIDTSGCVQTSNNLMQEISKIRNVINPNFTIFVGDALTGNDLVSQAEEFYKFTEFNGSILTKVDADVKGGALLAVLSETSKPIIYIGTGQDYKDLEKFNKDRFLSNLFKE